MVPPRIALASTINRVKIFRTEEYKALIRSHRYADHEFIRAQVVVALGLNGDPDDVEYLTEMADSENHYVIQSAITSLALLGHPKAKEAMITLMEKYANGPRGRLLRELLQQAYHWQPGTQ
jgi:HEAT repeat protein